MSCDDIVDNVTYLVERLLNDLKYDINFIEKAKECRKNKRGNTNAKIRKCI